MSGTKSGVELIEEQRGDVDSLDGEQLQWATAVPPPLSPITKPYPLDSKFPCGYTVATCCHLGQ
ncbi:MAG: hypothetical protein H6658_16465 [Ardenticatenaceae bacterium]|nr:hypothetical protein [Ardenticatenaceae bacterium]